jgi:hypothetical protein
MPRNGRGETGRPATDDQEVAHFKWLVVGVGETQGIEKRGARGIAQEGVALNDHNR